MTAGHCVLGYSGPFEAAFDPAGTNTVLGVTSWGQSVTCNDHNYFYRIDNTEALTFLNTPTTGVTS